MPGRWDWDRGEDDGRAGPEPVDARSFFAVLLVGALCGVLAFVWTVSNDPEATEGRGDPASTIRDPSPGWGGRLARPLFAMGRFEELAASAESRRRNWGRDPEAWLFGAFAHEQLAARPGLGAVEHRAEAARLWEELGRLATDRDRDGDGMPDFFRPFGQAAFLQGWALIGQGRPVMARERFESFLVDTMRRGGPGTGLYNRACYEALAGNHREAIRLWRDASRGGWIGDPLWSVVDPDLEAIHEDLWHEDLSFRVFTIFNDNERRAGPGSGAARTGPLWTEPSPLRRGPPGRGGSM